MQLEAVRRRASRSGPFWATFVLYIGRSCQFRASSVKLLTSTLYSLNPATLISWGRLILWRSDQFNTIQYKTCNAPYVTKMLFVDVYKLLTVVWESATFLLPVYLTNDLLHVSHVTLCAEIISTKFEVGQPVPCWLVMCFDYAVEDNVASLNCVRGVRLDSHLSVKQHVDSTPSLTVTAASTSYVNCAQFDGHWRLIGWALSVPQSSVLQLDYPHPDVFFCSCVLWRYMSREINIAVTHILVIAIMMFNCIRDTCPAYRLLPCRWQSRSSLLYRVGQKNRTIFWSA